MSKPTPTILHGIKNCDTMKKARAWLEARGVAYDFHDYETAGIDRATLEAWSRQVGWETLFNRAGTSWIIPAMLPEGLAAPFLLSCGFRQSALTQLEMEAEL